MQLAIASKASIQAALQSNFDTAAGSFQSLYLYRVNIIGEDVCLFVTEETCQVCPTLDSVRKHYEGAYGVNPMPVGHSEAVMTGSFTRL